MTTPDLEALAARLANGETLEHAMRGLQPEGRAELLKRCGAVHQFDAPLLEVLRTFPPAIEDSGLDDLRSAGAVEPVPGGDGAFRLPPLARREQYDAWWAEEPSAVIPERLRALSEHVLPHLQADSAEALYHRLLVDPSRGLEAFEAAFQEADRTFEQARCQDLLDVVVERLALLGPEGAEVCNRYKRRLRARSMWTKEWYATARFMLPEPSATATDELLAGDGARVLSLWSDGGMGKSSYLRWLITRRCVPEGDACALIDFDEIDSLLAGREPWLLLLDAAYQLDQQLPDAPFHELLAQYAGQRERLRRRASSCSAVGQSAAADIRERFCGALRELDPAQRVVVVLDTLEVALLLGGWTRDQSDLTPMLEQFGELVKSAPALRVVLTARHDLSIHVRDFKRVFPDARTLRIERFSDDEARLYLRRYRGIERPELVERIVRSAGGMPFKLELIADVAEQRPDLDPAELDAYADADMAYVMDRIVGRLDDGLRSFLLYGVAPRTLERSFADDVLAPLLGVEDADAPWRSLKRYAGGASWVMLDPAEVDAVRFHPVVLGPMRKLLRQEPEHDTLHLRAAEWYERRAADDPANATRWLCEAVYHRFQHEGPGARRYWERLLREARAERRHDRRRALAAEVLREDYVGPGGPLTWRDGRPLLEPKALLRARWELAFSAIQLAHPDSPDRRDGQWMEADRAIADLEHLQHDTSETLTESQMALLHAGIRLVRGDLEGAQPHIDRALRGHLAREDRLWLWLAYAGAVSASGGQEAAAHFRTALATARRGPDPQVDLAMVYHRLALHHADHDHIERALSACAAGAEQASGRQAVELALTRCDLELRRGAPAAGLAALPDTANEEPDVQARRGIMEVRLLLAAGHPLEALAAADHAADRFSPSLPSAGDREWAIAAHGREIRGKVRAALLDADGAIADYEEAQSRWSRINAAEGVCRSWVRGATLHLRGLGNLHEATVRLDQARRAHRRRGDDVWTRCTLAGADLLFLRGHEERAIALVDDVILALKDASRPPHALVAAAVQGLAVSRGGEQDRFLRLLCAQLSRVTPASARLSLLEGIDHCAPLSGATELRERLRRLVPSPVHARAKYPDHPASDLALLALRDAELDRLVGHGDDALLKLEHAWRRLDPDPSRATLHALVGAAVRANARRLVAELARRELSVIEPAGGAAPVLDGTALVQAAGVLDDPEQRGELLEVANELLDDKGAAAGAWPARLLELRARDAASAERALDFRRRAAELYEGMGDDVRRDRALGRERSGGSAPSEPVGEHELRVTLRMRDGALSVSTRDGEGGVGLLSDGAALARVQDALDRPAERLLADPAALGRDLAALLHDAVATVPDPGLVDLGLRAKHPAVRALPWELAAPALEAAGLRLFRRAPRTRGEPADIRAVQRTLNRYGERLSPDGNLGPDTRSALEDLQRNFGLPVTGQPDAETVRRLHATVCGQDRPVVAIVRPSRVAEERAFRGSRQSGVPIDWVYERAGFHPIVLDSPTGAELMSLLRDFPAAILHLNVGLVDHHGTPAIDLLGSPGVRGRAAAGRLTGTAMDHLIPRDLPAPLVVLDVTAPKSRRETAAQLLLRNAFAAELAAVGTVRAVLATGLARYGRQQRLYRALAGALRDGLDVYDVAAAVRALATDPQLDDALAFTATALFSRAPSVRFPAPR